MNRGKLVAGAILLSGAIAGGLLWWTENYAYYEPVRMDAVTITATTFDGTLDPLPIADFEGIDADTSPLRFRACFTTSASLAMMSETYRPYAEATPLNSPGWFDCYDAGELTDLRQVATHQRQQMPLIDTAYGANSLDRRLVAEVTAKRVTGVRRQGDDTTLTNDLRRPAQQPLLRIVRMYRNVLCHRPPPGSERFPDGFQPIRQRRQLTKIEIALARSVKIGTARRQKAVLPGVTSENVNVFLRVTARHHLHGASTQILEFAQKTPHFGA